MTKPASRPSKRSSVPAPAGLVTRPSGSAAAFHAPPLSAWGLLRRYALVSGLGLSVLGAGAFPQRAQAAPTFGTPGWYAQQNAQRLASPVVGQRSAGNINNAVNAPGTVVTASEALQRAQQSIADLNNALAAIRSQQAAQQAAAKAALNLNPTNPNNGAPLPVVPDGLGAGGLQIHLNTDGTNSVSGVDSISQKPGSSAGAVTVTVDQTASKAILNWDTFNVGKNTTLHFDQTKGTQANGSNNWVALNRVLDTTNPTQILGSIKAEGDVYIINQGGILFGGTSQVNTHSLIASSLPFLGDLCTPPNCSASNNAFLNQGLGIGSNTPVVGMTDQQFETLLQTKQQPGNIRIDAGASINTGTLGFALIAAPEVSNAGTITATDGQAILAGGVSVSLASSTASQTAGVNLPNLLVPTLTENVPVQGLDPSALSVTNTGLIQAQRGNITLAGLSVTQAGVVATTTSVTRPGSIVLEAGDNSGGRVGPLVLAPGSVTAILPDGDGETTTSTSTANSQFVSGSALLTGGTVTFEHGSLLEAPGATVSAVAVADTGATRITTPGTAGYDPGVAGRVYLDDGAVVDVSGLADVELSVADTLVTIPRVGLNELADSPLLRDGFLYGQSVTVDSTITGVRADGKTWVGSPIVDATGYVQNVPRTVNQLLTQAGTLNLAGAEVITHAGSVINLSGGYINYLGGMTTGTTRLLGADGRVYDISNADPNVQYVGFAGRYDASHPRWGYTDTYVDPLTSGALSHYQTGFIQGGDAGTLNIYASNGQQGVGNGTAILNGTISAQAFAGRNQVLSNSRPAGGSFSIGQTLSTTFVTPFGQTASIGNLIFPVFTSSGSATPPSPSSYIISAEGVSLDDIAPGFGAGTSLETAAMLGKAPSDPSNVLYWTPLSAAALSNAGFSSVSLRASGGQIAINPGATLAVQPGGKHLSQGVRSGGNGDSVNLSADLDITVNGTISAPSGNINLTSNGGNIVLGDGAKLDASGAFVNDSGLTPDQIVGSQFLNGGTVTLQTKINSVNGADTSGSIILAAPGTAAPGSPGSLIDVSSGAYVKPTGALLTSGGLPQGQGGTIVLQTYAGEFGRPNQPGLPNSMPTNGSIQGLVDPTTGRSTGVLRAYGFSRGGRLSLQALGYQIGDIANANPWDLRLDPSFFQQGGFSQYTLGAMYEATIAAGAKVSVIQQNYLPDIQELLRAPSGSALYGSDLVKLGTLDPYYRYSQNKSQGAGLSINAGGFLLWVGGGAGNNGVDAPTAYFPGVTGSVIVGQGGVLEGDVGATIALSSLQNVDVEGTIRASGGSISLTQEPGPLSVNNGGFGGLHGTDLSALGAFGVTLGSGSLLDASGTVLLDPNAPVIGGGKQRTGVVLAGGSVSVQAVMDKDNDPAFPSPVVSGNVVAEAGATINVSGASATFDLPQFSGAGTYAATSVWSNAGSVTLAAGNNLVYLGNLVARPGSPMGDGGSLTITAADGASAVILSQAAPSGLLPSGWQSGQNLSGSAAAGTLYFSADRLSGSGIASLTVNSNSSLTADLAQGTTGFQPGVLSLGFAGDVSLSLSKSFTANAAAYVALDPDATSIPSFSPGTTTTSGGTVNINAPYVALQGYSDTTQAFNFKPVAVQGQGSLNVKASFIDLNGDFALQNFANANFNSSGDIRFYTPVANSYHSFRGDQSIHPGELYTAGNLFFSGSQIYPGSASTFVIYAGGSGNPLNAGCAAAAICFEQPDASAKLPATPLSAGGTLVVDAATIEQDGVLRAPAGSLILGVGSTTDASVTTLLQGLNTTPVNTQSVTLGRFGTTSVSLDGAVIPYGTTLDGQEWQYNQLLNVAQTTSPDLTAPTVKQISLNGQNVSIDHDATVDLSGGGDLQAQEWVPGTGGSRNVLSQSTTTYPSAPVGSTVTPVTTYLYPDHRQIYAVIPAGGYYSATKPTTGVAVAPYDPVTAASGPAAGQTVYLSGAPGLPAGWYTLLPASYATLPGAFRVVQNTAAVDSTAAQNRVLQDGTDVVAGYFVDGLSGASAARSTSFNVQSGPVWQQYSQYTLSSANAFFAKLAAKTGSAVPQLPMDAGQLILGASGSLTLGDGGSPQLLTAGASGGAAAQIDIASQDIQIVGNGETALSGYVQLSANTLDKLGAGSLLIGGTRSQTSSGISINVTADSLVLSNDSADPLQGPEILLVAKGDAAGADATRLANKLPDGVMVQSGSVIKASGSLPAGADRPITISGDGALLRVSNAGAVQFTRSNVSRAAGDLNIGAGATIDGGKNLLLDATGNTSLDPTATLSATDNLTVDAGSITLVNGSTAPTGASGFIIGSGTLAQISGAQQLNLRSYGGIDFEGGSGAAAGCNGFCLDLAKGNLALSAGSLQTGLYGAPTAVSINVASGILSLTNDLNAPVLANPAAGSSTVTLALNAPEIDFGTAGSKQKSSMNFSGFGAITATATPAASAASSGAGIVGQGSQSFDFGTVPVTLNAPVIFAGTGSGASLKTSGALVLASASGNPLASAASAAGGAISLSGGSVADSALIEAPAGNVSLDASSGDLTIASGATVSTAGVARQFYDVTQYAPAGNISLTADAGNVLVQSGAKLDFSGAAGGGDAGGLSLSAPGSGKSVSIDPAAVVKGIAASGYQGGSFSEAVGGAADLHQLAALLSSDGILNSFSVHSGSGDLSLSGGDQLTAQNVYLNAAGGNLSLAAGSTINANGAMQADGTQAAGGSINLYGSHGVDVEGTLTATTGDAKQRGGTVNIGTGIISTAAVTSYNTDYGYENIAADNSGTIRIGSAAVIDVSGGSAGGLSGGTVSLRAPLLQTGQVNVDLGQLTPTNIKGARDVGLEAYAVWSTKDGTSGAQHFDGVIDPSGKTDPSGKAFYQTTLVNFVESPGGLSTDPANPAANHVSSQPVAFAFDGTLGVGIANFHIRPGIELDNPDGTVNNGDISLLSNWNLGAGTGTGSNIKLYYRYGNEAPVLTLRAADNLRIGANLGDGFFFTGSGNDPLTKKLPGNGISPSSADEAYYTLIPLDSSGQARESSSFRLAAGSDFGSADPLGLLSQAQLATAFDGGGNVILSGDSIYSYKGRPVDLPTTVRTGTGFIDVAAGGNFSLYDPAVNPGGQNVVAPGVVYTAGVPDALAPSPVTKISPLTAVLNLADIPQIAITGAVNPDAAGDLSIHAQGDILGLEQVYDDSSGSITGAVVPNNFIAQFWWPWMQLGRPADGSASTINFGGFGQGILSTGGNVKISAGGDIRELSVSLPTTWYLSTDSNTGQSTVNTVGGGNLSVTAGGDILSGSYFVSNGSGSIVAGGKIAPDFSVNLAAIDSGVPATATAVPVATLLALQQNSTLKVSARQGVDIGGVYNPSYLADPFTINGQGFGAFIPAGGFDSQTYGSSSGLSVFATTGDVRFDTLTEPTPIFEYGREAGGAQTSAVSNPGTILPANLALAAFSGDALIDGTGTMYPSNNGELSVLAAGTVQLSNLIDAANNGALGLSDASVSAFPSPLNPVKFNTGYSPFDVLNLITAHQTTSDHVADSVPVRIYSLTGSIIDADGGSVHLVTPKPAQIYAAQDIVDLALLAQNLRATDVTRVVAGRDIYDSPQPGQVGSNVGGAALQVAGPGYFDIEAGRNLGPLATPGISTIGNADNSNLPHQGASIQVLFGIGPSLDLAKAVLDASAFISRYIDPAHAGSTAGVPSYAKDLASFMAQYPAQLAAASGDSWKAFQALPKTQQNLFAEQVFYKILQLTAQDYNDPNSTYYHQYARGYDAINTLFPPSAGYTANNLTGGANGTIGQPVDTGDLDIRNSTVQTQQGGSIAMFGPGGQALVGSTSAPPVLVNNAGVVVVGAAGLGILTLEKGDVDIFTDRSLLLAQSRVFTEQGGDMLIWSSNGDINAGKGAKTTAETPPPQYNCDPDHNCTVDARGQVSGAGIATLQTIPGAAPGNVFLVAPRGTVDAGEAGIRVSGNLVVAAQAVANASNIQVSGNKVGVPVVAHVDTGALAAANAAAAAAEQAAAPAASTGERAASLITVEVVGLGSPDEEEKRRLRRKVEGN